MRPRPGELGRIDHPRQQTRACVSARPFLEQFGAILGAATSDLNLVSMLGRDLGRRFRS
jgi:hypothetical protein